MSILLPFSIGAPVMAFAFQHRLFDLQLNTAWMFCLLFIGQEFFYYWFHRASHRIRWFWASHSVHHSPNELNFAAAYRLGITSRLAGSTLFYAPLTWLGFDPTVVLSVVGINLLYQYWIHADWIPKLGWIEFILNTPSHHRVHHSRQLMYLDCNYGGTRHHLRSPVRHVRRGARRHTRRIRARETDQDLQSVLYRISRMDRHSARPSTCPQMEGRARAMSSDRPAGHQAAPV